MKKILFSSLIWIKHLKIKELKLKFYFGTLSALFYLSLSQIN
jgi:hypothetical protein